MRLRTLGLFLIGMRCGLVCTVLLSKEVVEVLLEGIVHLHRNEASRQEEGGRDSSMIIPLCISPSMGGREGLITSIYKIQEHDNISDDYDTS